MNIFNLRGIKLFTDLDIDFNIYGFTPKDKLCLFVGNYYDEIKWHCKEDDCFERLTLLATVNEIPLYAPLSGKLEKIYYSDFNGDKCIFCTILLDKEQPPLYSVLDHTETPNDIFALKKLSQYAAIFDDYKKQPFYNTLITTKKYKKVVLNCCDDQPYIVSKSALLMNYTEEILGGLDIVQNCLQIKYKELAIFKNFIINKFLKNNVKNIKVLKLKTKYPINTYFNKKEHFDNALILTPEICKAIYRASYFNEPATTKTITAWGDALKNPKVIELPLGTLVNDILDFCQSEKNIGKIVSSGVISGYLTAPYLPITVNDDSITAMLENRVVKPQECINCGKCLEVCPVGLAPCYILQKPNKISEKAFFKTFKYCIECGCCSYVCPANIPLKAYIEAYNTEVKKVQDEQN